MIDKKKITLGAGIGIAAMCFALLFIRAFFEWRFNSDPWYAIILLAGVGLFVFAMWPIRKQILGGE